MPNLPAGQFPLLSRIAGMYEDVIYKKHEIEALKKECFSAKPLATSEAGLNGLEKLVQACNLAVRENTGIYLASD